MNLPDLSRVPRGLRIGTSSFSSPDWSGTFYPASLKPAEFLGYYAARFPTVEIDATWHAMPTQRTVEAWAERVPRGFSFSTKVPKIITHDRCLEGCDEEWDRFLRLIDFLGEKRGPVLFQFPYVSRGKDPEEFRTGAEFRRRLAAFLPQIPTDGRYVIEVRNRTWLKEPLLDLIRSRGIALALVDYFTMPRGPEVMDFCDPVTADFAYIRFLGDHRTMDQDVARAREKGSRGSDWGEVLVDRTEETRSWIPAIRTLLERVPEVYAYFNNHYAGFAPGSIDLFLRLWADEVGEAPVTAEAGVPLPDPAG